MKDGQGNMVSACEYTGSGIHSIDLNLWRLSPSTAPMYKMICEKKTKDGLDGLGDLACWYNEKHAELRKPLPTNAIRPGTIRSGDLMLYGPRTLVVFYQTFNSPYAYTRLGHVDEPAGLAQALGSGSVRIEFSKG